MIRSARRQLLVNDISEECRKADVDEDYARGIARQSLQADTLPSLTGSTRINSSSLPSHLRTLLQMGTGYFRPVNAAIELLFRERNALRLRESKNNDEYRSGP